LAADEVDEQGDRSPDKLVSFGHLYVYNNLTTDLGALISGIKNMTGLTRSKNLNEGIYILN
jgi:hypothetical protein